MFVLRVTVVLMADGSRVSTTEDHPFWNHTDAERQRADALDPGDLLPSAAATSSPLNGMVLASTRTTTAHNLTVDDIHTYFVVIDGEGVLVHDTCGPNVQLQLFDDAPHAAGGRPYTVEASARLSPSSYPGRSEYAHFAESDASLHARMAAYAGLASRLERAYPGIANAVAPGPRRGFLRASPHANLTWHHHPTVPGLMQLVPSAQHTSAIHLAGGRGGMSGWG